VLYYLLKAKIDKNLQYNGIPYFDTHSEWNIYFKNIWKLSIAIFTTIAFNCFFNKNIPI